MLVEWAQEKMDGGLLYTILERHQLLPPSLSDPRTCIMVAEMMSIGILHDGSDEPLALMIESYPESGVVGLLFITEVPRLNQRRDELIEVSMELRKRWFDDFKAYRIESRIPVERTQTIRCLKHMGFKIETVPKCMRNGAVYNGKPKDLCMLSLLPSDPIHELSNNQKEPILLEGVEA